MKKIIKKVWLEVHGKKGAKDNERYIVAVHFVKPVVFWLATMEYAFKKTGKKMSKVKMSLGSEIEYISAELHFEKKEQ